jgi:predicted RNA methylase
MRISPVSVDSEGLLRFHAAIVADPRRASLFREAISKTVRPGDLVLDIGCGTGILGFFALQAGARKVIAVDNGDVIDLARAIARKNGTIDRIEFLHADSTRVEREERADVAVADLCGSFGINAGLLALMADARRRLVKPNGRIIPRAVCLFAAPVEHPGIHRGMNVWSAGVEGVDLSAARTFAQNNPYHVELAPDAPLSDARSIARVDLHEIDRPDVEGSAEFTISRDGTLHGIAGWFEAELSPGVAMTNGPVKDAIRYRQLLFPIPEPLAVSRGAPVSADFRSASNGSVWTWSVTIGDRSFRHSSFLGFPLSEERFKKTSSEFAPKLSRRGEAHLFVLQACRGDAPLSDIERRVLERFPDCFRTLQEAADFVRNAVLTWA